jgi:hypothetical protein
MTGNPFAFLFFFIGLLWAGWIAIDLIARAGS